MEKFNLNNKKFTTVANSKDGKASSATVFHYRQKGKVVTAGYQGGDIVHGKIIAKLIGEDELEMLYQCLTTDDELKAGKAIAKMGYDDEGLIRLKLNWEWLDDSNQKGTSEYVEIPK